MEVAFPSSSKLYAELEDPMPSMAVVFGVRELITSANVKVKQILDQFGRLWCTAVGWQGDWT